ncbi:hypothetical protein ACIBJE_27455 [Micromonospora sp. NPDC050187]|uniref:hypothetical protein n=1 Tax=Micromonospora sp. NPDC050187 TaxID=3364277 RepID=UPI003792A8BC
MIKSVPARRPGPLFALALAGCASATLAGCTAGASNEPVPQVAAADTRRVDRTLCDGIDYQLASAVFGERMSAIAESDEGSVMMDEPNHLRCGEMFLGRPGLSGGTAAVDVSTFPSGRLAREEYEKPKVDFRQLSGLASPLAAAFPATLDEPADDVRLWQTDNQTIVEILYGNLVVTVELSPVGENTSLGRAAADLPTTAVALADQAFAAVRQAAGA